MSNFNKAYDRTSTGKKRNYRKTQYRFYSRNPTWWNRIYTTKKRREDDRINMFKIKKGCEHDCIV
ncbi:hypothetical protein O9380_20420, partial [Proteus mirabilis]